MIEACYRRTGPGAYASTDTARGAWTPIEQHMAAATGLIVEELGRVPVEGPPKRIARIALDILGTIHMGPVEVVTRVVRPGRRIELVEAELRTQGRTSILARAWRLAIADTDAVAGIEDPPMPGPDEAAPLSLDMWPDGFVRTVEVRALPDRRAGAGRVWLRAVAPVIADEPTSQLGRILGLTDVANGVVPRTGPTDGITYPNVDLQIHLYRDPVGDWLGLDTRQAFGPTGTGLTSSVMHDVEGPFGRLEQTLVLLPGGHG